MNNTINLEANILSIIYDYFPTNISDADESYWETKEFLRLKEKCEEVSANTDWSNFYDRLREQFPYYLIIDQTRYFDYDRGFSMIITFKNELKDIRYFEVLVSFIVPYYTISLTETNGRGAFKYNINSLDVTNYGEKAQDDLIILRQLLLEFFPYDSLDETIGKKVINDLAFQNMSFGEVNVYKAIYNNYIFY